MSFTHTVAEKIRKGDALPGPVSMALLAATPATRLAMLTRKLRSRVRVDARVISIGNLTTGGTGKTPAVIRQLGELSTDSEAVLAVLTRGYGTGNAHRLTVSCDVPADRYCEVLGDEPALILRNYPHVLVVKGRDRIGAARLAIEHGCNTLVLDDGFQYVQLQRDVNQLLIDATNPFGNGHLLPRGILREPLSAMARATEIVLTRCDQSRDIDSIEATIRRYTHVPILRATHRPTGFVHARSGEQLPLDHLAGQHVAIASAVGNPESFRATVESIGLHVTEALVYRDHATIPRDDLPQNISIIVTEKDSVKMENAADNVYALSVALEPLA